MVFAPQSEIYLPISEIVKSGEICLTASCFTTVGDGASTSRKTGVIFCFAKFYLSVDKLYRLRRLYLPCGKLFYNRRGRRPRRPAKRKPILFCDKFWLPYWTISCNEKNRRKNCGSLSLHYFVNYAFLNSPHFAADGVIPTSILSESLLRKAGTGFSFTSKR